MRRFLFLIVFFTSSNLVYGYVAGTSVVRPGGWEVLLKTELMRGLSGPENLPETQQTQVPHVNIYEVGGAYSVGTKGVFQDIKVRLSGSYYKSAAELLLGIPKYPLDDGWILGAEISANFIHEPERLLGVFLRSQNPLGMNVEKFINPKVDRIGLGVQTAFKFSEDFGQEMVLFFGSGVKGGGFEQNPAITLSLLGAWIIDANRGAVLRIGPFFEGDIGERKDAQYGTQGVRAFRLGMTIAASYEFVKDVALEASFTQKFSGNYFRATKDFIVSIRSIF